MSSDVKPLRAVTYTRISKDKAGDAHGVANQQKALDKHARERGWRIVARLSDNDISASNGKHRPDYERVLAMVDAGEVDVVLCWAVDRFVRRVADLESVIGRFTRAGAKLAAVSGDMDLSSDAGRTVARMLSVIAQGEVERKSARQQLAAQSAAAEGKRWTGCPRPFGWAAVKADGKRMFVIDPDEAAAIRWAADALLGGSTVSAVMRHWNDQGLRTAQKDRKPFSRQSVTTILRNPRIAGLNAYKGEITGPGDWDPVLPEHQWRAVRELLGDPSRKPQRGVRTLLGGLAACRCGNVVTGSQNQYGTPIYRCQPPTRNGRPGPHATIRLAPVDDYVVKVITGRLARDDAADLITPPAAAATDVAGLRREAASIRANLDEMAADRALGLVSRTQLIKATQRGSTRLGEIEAELAASASVPVLAPFAAAQNAATVWEGLDLARRRAVLSALCMVTLHPAGRGARVFDPATVEVRWRSE